MPLSPTHMTQSKGFTLIELMIVIAIVGILAAIGSAQYKNYIDRATFTELVNASHPHKSTVAICFLLTRDITECDSGQHGIASFVRKDANTIGVNIRDGVIQIVARDGTLLREDGTNARYHLRPTIDGEDITWQKICRPTNYC